MLQFDGTYPPGVAPVPRLSRNPGAGPQPDAEQGDDPTVRANQAATIRLEKAIINLSPCMALLPANR